MKERSGVLGGKREISKRVDFFFLKDPAPTETSPLPLHAALPIKPPPPLPGFRSVTAQQDEAQHEDAPAADQHDEPERVDPLEGAVGAATAPPGNPHDQPRHGD